MQPAFRTLVSALSMAALVLALARVECPPCGTKVAVSGSMPCCDHLGNCKGSAESPRSNRCVNGDASNLAVLQQPLPLAPLMAHISVEMPRPVSLERQQGPATNTWRASPPLYLLNSSFLV